MLHLSTKVTIMMKGVYPIDKYVKQQDFEIEMFLQHKHIIKIKSNKL